MIDIIFFASCKRAASLKKSAIFLILTVILLTFSLTSCLAQADEGQREVVVLMYHNFTNNEYNDAGDFTVTAAKFEEQLNSLKNAGYEFVFFSELIDFVENRSSLPEKCAVITSDDGYQSVLDVALPVCKKLGVKMSCAVIGEKVDMPTHFYPTPDSCDSDILELTSHTYALHDGFAADGEEFELTETDIAVLRDDIAKMTGLFADDFPMTAQVFTYPHNAYSEKYSNTLRECGYKVTVTCDYGVAVLERGRADSLLNMPRISVYENTTGADILRLIRKAPRS